MGWIRADVEARREKVARLLLGRKSEREIAAELGIGKSQAHEDVAAVRLEWRRSRLGNQDQLVGEELAKLGVAESAIWPAVEVGKGWAIDKLLAIMARRSAYLGLDAPTKSLAGGEQTIRVEHVNDWRPAAHATPGATTNPPTSAAVQLASGGPALAENDQ